MKRSRYQLWLVSGAHLVAGLSPWLARTNGWSAILSFLILLHWLDALREQGWLGRSRAINGVRYAGEQWSIALDAAGWVRVELAGQPLITPFLTILPFRSGHRTHNAVLFSDAVDPEAFRTLRVRLLLGH
ncbi:protein YgfX [Kistimonas scapharcae]|uniref:protein YgfX n=1 Tax=Kistimonas scapharcae TaxID=1036133 RepID=UPI0031E95379